MPKPERESKPEPEEERRRAGRAIGSGRGRAVAALGILLLSACAGTPTSPDSGRVRYDDCFFASTLHDWRPLDDENLILFADGRRAHHVQLFGPAIGLAYDVTIGVYDRDGRICPYGGDAIVVDGVINDRVPIRSIRRLSDAELEEVYAEFGIRPPRVIEAEEVEPDESAEP